MMALVEKTFILPFPPSVNAMYANVPRVGRVKTKAYRAWFKLAATQIRLQRGRLIPGPVEIAIRITRPDNRRRDIDNLSKAVLDLMVAMAIIEDDSRVVKCTTEWGAKEPTPVAYVTVTKRPADESAETQAAQSQGKTRGNLVANGAAE